VNHRIVGTGNPVQAPREQFLPETLGFLNPIVIDDLKRCGHADDGGYLLPASRLGEIDAMVSFGISSNWTLEEDVARQRPDLVIQGYDHTVGRKRFAERIMLEIGKMFFLQSNPAKVMASIRTYRAYRKFFRNSRQHFGQRIYNRADSGMDATIDLVFGRIPGKSHVFLKMDIEGAEYRVIPQILKYASRIDLMAIEFHDTDPLRDVFVKQVRELLADFEIVHLHGNNFGAVAEDGLPDFLEMTLVNRRFCPVGARRRNHLPIAGIDAPNSFDKPDIVMDFV
jgi:hypothetical protein